MFGRELRREGGRIFFVVLLSMLFREMLVIVVRMVWVVRVVERRSWVWFFEVRRVRKGNLGESFDEGVEEEGGKGCCRVWLRWGVRVWFCM